MLLTHLFRPIWAILLPICLTATQLLAQDRYVPGQVLVSLAPNAVPADFLPPSTAEGPSKWQVLGQPMRSALNIWLLETSASSASLQSAIQWLQQQPQVLRWQYNHYVQDRDQPSTRPYGQPLNLPYPTDPLFNLQWHFDNTGQGGGTVGADLGMVQAWETTKGGVSAAGDTVVVAVIDGGLCPYCDDWGNNLWTNRHEIPNDGIDNDGNGYFDDYKGWNVNAQNDDITGYTTGHGTSVAGVIAARGNDNIGISGMLWDTKLMFVAGTSGASTTESQVLAAYDYVHQARKTYNTTNGQKGAFVVAVNCSFGIDYGTPSQSPLWCTVLDQLGEVGILTIGAVTNADIDIDEVGDIPSTCPSEYLITTTSIDRHEQRAPSSGYGANSVDLAAFGHEIYTLLATNPPYGYRSGTSFAAPQVTGAVGLLFTAPCHNLIALTKDSPAAAAKWAKDLILETSTPLSSLQGICVTGGRLQMDALLNHYEDQCQSCPAPYWLMANATTTEKADLSWTNSSIFEQVDLRWRMLGDTNWFIVQQVSPPYTVSGLLPCTTYEFSLRAQCSGETSSWSAAAQFTTDGCCVPPNVTGITILSPDSAMVSWQNVTAATTFHLRYRSLGSSSSPTWIYLNNLSGNTALLTNLVGCTYYEAQIQSGCGNTLADFSPVFTFQTKGCGACYDHAYCTAKAENANYEWIESVSIGTWEHISAGNQGYQDFSGNSNLPILDLLPQTTLIANIVPGFSSTDYFEMFRIYIDFDLDGDFSDPGELVFDPGFAHNGPISDAFTVPSFPSWGISKMRVIMKYKANNDPYLPGACETFDFGQVEDYCVRLLQNATPSHHTIVPLDKQVLLVSPNPFSESIAILLDNNNTWAQFTLTDLTGRLLKSGTLSHHEGRATVQGLGHLPSGMYLLRCTDATGQVQAVARVVK